jgi:dolichol-phosphate mannosyltransferase
MSIAQLKSVSIVVPVYCNEESLEILFNELQDEQNKNFNYVFEYIFVDDGSHDASLEKLLNIKNQLGNCLMVVQLSRNFGQLAAMKAGYSISSGDLVISISADLQDPTDLISLMLKKYEEGFDIVACNRIGRSDSLLSRLTSKLGYAILRNRVKNIPHGGFDVFLFSSQVRSNLMALRGRFSFLQGDLLNLGFSIGFVGYHRKSRPFGKSGYNFSKRFQNFVDAVIDTSYKLIQNSIKTGIIFAGFGFVIAFTVIYGKFIGRDPFNGFALLASAIFIIGGTQIILIGLVGEYIWRVYDLSRNKPQFVIKQIY